MAKKESTSRFLVKNLLLRPLSVVYGAVTATRNKMFDVGVLEQREFDIPVLVVGNIAVGGTGKTPHTEYLVDLLRTRYNIGVLSRGYNRRTKGFRLAGPDSDARQIGDEPYQIYRKYGDKGVTVAVCEDRARGIDKMRKINPAINLIILDDAFQHRYVKPALTVVLTEHSHPVYDDSMLPAGRLRESLGALHRADIVVVTKCPDDMKQLDYRLFAKNLELYPYQKLFFSRYHYGALQPVFPDVAEFTPNMDALSERDTIVALAGISNPRPFIKRLRDTRAKIRGIIFSDHHNFTRDDMVAVVEKIKTSPDPAHTFVVTTEKDAMRLRAMTSLPKGLKCRLFYIPISVQFIPNMADTDKAGPREFAETLLKMLSDKSKFA